MITLFHGSCFKIDSLKENQCIYATPILAEAKKYALGLDDLGNYNEESFIYALDVDETKITVIEDFAEMDSMGYWNYDNMPEIAYNPESQYYCIKHPDNIRLVEHYKNEL